MMPVLSVAIIVKDEEEVIERCLKSVGQFADEIVVVDTGSQDRTMELARRHTPNVFASDKFTKDTHYSDFEFGAAKNEAIRHCTGDWICWVDADDYFNQEVAQKIRELVQTAKPESLYSFIIKCGNSQLEHTRLFPARKNILFDETHACHEYLLSNGLPILVRRDILIEHLPVKKSVPSSVRNLAILEKDFYERGRDDTRTMFYLANAYRELGNKEKAIEFYDQYLQKSEWTEERLFARLFKSQCLPPKKALKELYRALAEDDRFAEIYCGIGDALFGIKIFRSARLWYEMAQTLTVPKDARLFVTPAKYNAYPQTKMAECGRMLGGTNEKFSFPVDEIKGVRVVHRDRAAERENERLAQQDRVVHRDRAAERENERLAQQDEKKKEKAVFSVRLPGSWSEALMATQAVLAKCLIAQVNVMTDDEQIADIYTGMSANLTVNAPVDDAVELSLPENMQDEHAALWFAKQLEVDIKQTHPVVPPGLPSGNSLLGQLMRLDKFVALQACPDNVIDEWPETRWSLVVQHFLSQGLKVVQLDSKDKKIAGTIAFDGGLESARCVISMCKLFFGVYGWATHLAAAISKPSVLLWGGSRPANFGYANHTNIIRDVPCRFDCSSRRSCGKMTCMRMISVRSVLYKLGAETPSLSEL